MDYLTNYYKNQAEQLQEQLNLLQSKLKSLQEDVFTPSWGGPGIPDTEAGTIELENMARQKKRTSLFGPVKQSKEWEELNAEIERRRGRGQPQQPQQQAPAQPTAQTAIAAAAMGSTDKKSAPVNKMGPKGTPSAVPTQIEVDDTQRVADETGLPTALPTNVQPGMMNMTDMDGNPIYVQPKPKKPSTAEFNANAAAYQEAGEEDFDEGGEYTSSNGYAQSPTSWANRYPSKYPAKPKKPSPEEFNAEAPARQEATEVDYDGGGDYTSSGGYAQSPTSWANRYPSKYPAPQQPKAVAPGAVRGESEMPEQSGGGEQPDWVLRWAKKLGDTPEKIEGMRQQAIRQIRSEK